MRLLQAALAAGLIAVLSVGRVALSAEHPLDPLSKDEIAAAVSILKTVGHVDDETRFPLLTLAEPPKADVLKWKTGDPLQRRAFAVIKQASKTFESVVDLTAGKVESWREVANVQPSFLLEELIGVDVIVKADPVWQEAMRKRGIRSFDKIVCLPLAAGYFGDAAEKGHRLTRAACFDARSGSNYWARPIEGVIAVTDLNERKVLKVVDTGVVPIPNAPGEYGDKSGVKLREAPSPIVIEEPRGHSFSRQGSQILWQNWSLRLRIDPRVGLVVSTVGFNDGGKLRSVLYQGSLSEIFVPYMDPASGWYFRTYMDAGEYGVGKLAVPLVPGADCPGNAAYLSDVIADDRGAPQERQKVACIFERESGQIAWRHYDFISQQTESRPGRELVLRLIAAVGNYDYIFDWVFQQDGTIRVVLGASGIDEVKAVTGKNAADDRKGDSDYGRFVAENTVATDHDHFFSFRLDLDVDGTGNSFVAEHLKKVRLGRKSARRSLWVAEPVVARVEADAKLHGDMEHPAIWRVINPSVINSQGSPVSYELAPGHDAMDLLDDDDYPRRRAGFADYQLWVTPYRDDERYAGGAFPNQSTGGDGLPLWTRKNRPVENTDIVLWYTMGFHHVPCPEDWPVMPTVWHQFELRPAGFFARNPALDLPAK